MAMALMVTMKASRDSSLAEFSRLICLSKKTLAICLFVCSLALNRYAVAESIVTPTFEIEQVFVDNEFDDFSETGSITQIFPGVIIISNGAKADFSLAYALNVARSNNLERDDKVNHRLNMDSEFRHKPEWTSYARAVGRLTNGDIDGVQSRNPDVNDNNSEQLYTFDTGTAYSERFSRDIQYSAGLQLDYADQDDSDSSTGQSVAFTMDNNISDNILTWEGLVQSRLSQSGSDDERVDILGATFNYNYDQTLSAFVELGTIHTDSSDLDENKYLAGLRWSPTRQSFIRVGVGKLGDDETYELDASITRARTLFAAKYTEKIEAVRDQLFNEQNDQFGQSTQTSTSINTVLRKRGDFAITQFGARSTITFSVFYDEISNPDDRNDQTTKGAEVDYDRQLSSRSRISITAVAQETDFDETGDLYDYTVSYIKSTSEDAEFEVFAGYETFDSTDNAEDYDQKSVGVEYKIAF
jgi:hypothetical protein